MDGGADDVSEVRVYMIGLGYARAWLNGYEVTIGRELGPWTTFRHRALYTAHALPSTVLAASEASGARAASATTTNATGVAVAVRLGNGQWKSKWTRASSPAVSPVPLLLRLQVVLCFRNGSIAAVVPPLSGWRAARGPVVSNDV